MRRRLHRRGGQALEFALGLPISLALLAGLTDYHLVMKQRGALSVVARDAARAGSLVPLGEPVESEANAQGRRALELAGLDGTVDCVLAGFSPDQEVRCEATSPVTPLFGFVPLPDDLTHAVTMRMEEQP
jgi:hypothetical protein